MGRIALCGVFDIPNYGDHLFPLVLREELSRRGYAGNVVLFSPFQAEESFVENSNVHSLDDLERMHMEEPFSAIVVGGGEIIHWHRFGQKRTFNSTDFEAYPMDKVWLVPCFMKMKYNVPLLWNAPGIPFDFDADKALAHYLFSNIDYLSVRNDFSKQVLIDCGIPDAAIQRVPDTECRHRPRTPRCAQPRVPRISALCGVPLQPLYPGIRNQQCRGHAQGIA